MVMHFFPVNYNYNWSLWEKVSSNENHEMSGDFIYMLSGVYVIPVDIDSVFKGSKKYIFVSYGIVVGI